MSHKSPAYRITCPKCGAAPWEPCITTDDSRHKAWIGKAKKQPHIERSIDGREHADKVGPKNVVCPSCGAAIGDPCRRYSRTAANKQGWEYCAPWGTKHGFCLARAQRTHGYGFLDPNESAAESGVLTPPEWHESAAEIGLLAEVDLCQPPTKRKNRKNPRVSGAGTAKARRVRNTWL